MPGTVTPFVDFLSSNDTGENKAASVKPIVNGDPVEASVQNRAPENLRLRTEAIRSALGDTLYLRDSDRALLVTGPGKVTWPGSTTAGLSGIPTLSDVIWLLPMLTPGAAQAQPIPPVASKYGTLHLKRASDSMNSILVTSMRRSYAAGDQINITVTTGSVYSCTLADSDGYQRTIAIVVTGSTTLGTVVSSLNALTADSPATQLVSAVLEGGALTSDIILGAQARQFVAGNYDGEGHAIVPANLASFFTANPTSALAEGDTLCVQYAMVADTASTGGRRQAIPENSNTAVPSGSFFNSRLNPEKLVNALPICKVVNGSLVFGTGVEIGQGATATLSSSDIALQAVVRNHNFEVGSVIATPSQLDIPGWIVESGAVNGTFRKATTTVRTGAASLEFNRTSTSAASAFLSQRMVVPVTPNGTVRLVMAVRQLIAPTGGTYKIAFDWNTSAGIYGSQTSHTFSVNGSTDSSWRIVDVAITVPASRYALSRVAIWVDGVTTASTGVALVIDDLQIYVETPTNSMPVGVDDTNRTTQVGYMLWVNSADPETYKTITRNLGDGEEIDPNHTPVAISAAPQGSTLTVEPGTAGAAPTSLAVLGALWALGAKLLSTAGYAREARVSAPYSGTHAWTRLWQSETDAATAGVAYNVYMDVVGDVHFVVNAEYSGTNWSKYVNGTSAFMLSLKSNALRLSHRANDQDAAWTTWTAICEFRGGESPSLSNPDFAGLLSFFDAAGNRHVAFDHYGLPRTQAQMEVHQNWLSPMFAAWDTVGTGTIAVTVDGGTDRPGPWLGLSVQTATPAAGKKLATPALNPSTTVLANALYVLEFDVSAASLVGTPSYRFLAGFHGDDPDTATQYIQLEKNSTNANWLFRTSTLMGANEYDTGVAPTSAPQRIRIEIPTSGWPGTISLYINGVLVATSTDYPESVPLYLGVHFDGTGTAKSVYVSPMTYRMYRKNTDDNV